MSRTTIPIIFVFALVALTSVADAQQGRRPRKPAQAVQGGFSQDEKDIIARYFADAPQEVKSLPPGIAKNLARGKPLPPGIAKQQLPESLSDQLPSRTGLEITIFGDRIVLLDVGGLVVDVLEGIFK